MLQWSGVYLDVHLLQSLAEDDLGQMAVGARRATVAVEAQDGGCRDVRGLMDVLDAMRQL